MVKYQEIDLDRLIYAISDRTRRRIMDELIRGERSIGELSLPFKMSLPAVMKHVEILKETGFIETKKVGRRVMCNLKPDNLIRVATWMAKYQKQWEGQLLDLERNINKTGL